MSDPNIITAHSWAAGIFQQKLPASLTDAEKRAELVYEINTPLVQNNLEKQEYSLVDKPYYVDRIAFKVDNSEQWLIDTD